MPAELPSGAVETRRVVQAVLREWSDAVGVSAPGATSSDFTIRRAGPLGLQVKFLVRLYFVPMTPAALAELHAEALAMASVPVAIGGGATHPNVELVDRDALARLCAESAVLGVDGGMFSPRPDWLSELRAELDVRLALTSGLFALTALARNRVPAKLRWTQLPAHELFERCFFQSMVTVFQTRGVSWGTKKRGRVIPDGWLALPSEDDPLLYDCKASFDGFHMEYRDVLGFADYLKNPIAEGWKPNPGQLPRFLVISSAFRAGSRGASLAGRQAALQQKVPGSRLSWMRADHLRRFALAIERDGVEIAHRSLIRWDRVLDEGEVTWSAFERELSELRTLGYRFEEA